MDLTQLANLGEFIGGVAVLVTLVYLALQVRHNTDAVASVSSQAVTTTSADFLMRMAENRELATIFLKLTTDSESMDETDRIRSWMFLRAVFRTQENQYYQNQKGFLVDFWPGYLNTLRLMLSAPYIRAWWRLDRSTFGSDFRELVDHEIASADADPTALPRSTQLVG